MPHDAAHPEGHAGMRLNFVLPLVLALLTAHAHAQDNHAQDSHAQDNQAQDNPALYQATAIVTGNDMRELPVGFAQCLTEVLVKASGTPRLRDDPAVTKLAEHADTLVNTFSYVDPRAWYLPHDDQGTYDRSYELTVRFDPARIDAALATLGVAPWRDPRPCWSP
jgi:hypothetical protein